MSKLTCLRTHFAHKHLLSFKNHSPSLLPSLPPPAAPRPPPHLPSPSLLPSLPFSPSLHPSINLSKKKPPTPSPPPPLPQVLVFMGVHRYAQAAGPNTHPITCHPAASLASRPAIWRLLYLRFTRFWYSSLLYLRFTRVNARIVSHRPTRPSLPVGRTHPTAIIRPLPPTYLAPARVCVCVFVRVRMQAAPGRRRARSCPTLPGPARGAGAGRRSSGAAWSAP